MNRLEPSALADGLTVLLAERRRELAILAGLTGLPVQWCERTDPHLARLKRQQVKRDRTRAAA